MLKDLETKHIVDVTDNHTKWWCWHRWFFIGQYEAAMGTEYEFVCVRCGGERKIYNGDEYITEKY